MRAFRLGDRIICPELNEIRSGPHRIHLEPKVMAVLLLLARSPFELVSKEQLLTTVWAGTFVGDAVLTNAISLIRRALGDRAANPGFVQTVPKRGYRLITPVVRCDAPNSPAEVPLDRLVSRARHLRHEETVSTLMQARLYAEEIVARYPRSGAAHAEIALTDLLLEKLGVAERAAAEPRVRASVEAALAADNGSAAAYVAAAKVAYIYDWDWLAGEQYLRRAISIDAADADARTELAIMLMNLRRFEEAVEHLHAAYQLDPLSPVVNAQLGHSFFYQGDLQSASAWYERLLRLSPSHLFGRWCLAAALEHSAQPERAKAVIEDGLEMHGSTGIPLLVTLCRVHLTRQEVSQAFSMLDRLKELGADSLLMSHVYSRFGERQLALAHLEKAAERRHYRVSDVNVLPSFHSLREERAFQAVMRDVGVHCQTSSGTGR